jgi:hypothetical protein
MHLANPSTLVEAAFRRIQIERLADMPILNPARLTARASRLALLQEPPAPEAPPSPSRRGFLTGRIDSGKRHA